MTEWTSSGHLQIPEGELPCPHCVSTTDCGHLRWHSPRPPCQELWSPRLSQSLPAYLCRSLQNTSGTPWPPPTPWSYTFPSLLKSLHHARPFSHAISFLDLPHSFPIRVHASPFLCEVMFLPTSHNGKGGPLFFLIICIIHLWMVTP